MSVSTWALMPVCVLHLTETSQTYFWQTSSCLVSACTDFWLLPTRLRNVAHSEWRFSRLIPPLPSLPCEMRARTCSEEDTCALSLNTPSLNSLPIRRRVTSLTLPPPPSFSPSIACTHPCLPAFIPRSRFPSFPRFYLPISLRSRYLSSVSPRSLLPLFAALHRNW